MRDVWSIWNKVFHNLKRLDPDERRGEINILWLFTLVLGLGIFVLTSPIWTQNNYWPSGIVFVGLWFAAFAGAWMRNRSDWADQSSSNDGSTGRGNNIGFGRRAREMFSRLVSKIWLGVILFRAFAPLLAVLAIDAWDMFVRKICIHLLDNDVPGWIPVPDWTTLDRRLERPTLWEQVHLYRT